MKFFLEILESLGLLICLLLASPFRFFRRLDHLAQITEHSSFLIRNGLFADLLRARLDYRMGNYHQSGVLLAPIIRYLERMIQANKENRSPLKLRRLLCTLYCDQQQIYFLCGQMEEAVMTVIRAHSFLGIDRLPSNPDLDLKTAHVVKAGVAASKMLEEGGLATLMVRQGEEPVVSRPPQKIPGRGFRPTLTPAKKPSLGVVIPFPSKT
jgi:hypothetical protein